MSRCVTWRIEQDKARGKWVKTYQKQCKETYDAGRYECQKERDDGYNRCDEQRDQGYNSCSGWWRWFCRAWVWISNIVCVAWTWVSYIVCETWVWVSNIVCRLWVFIVNLVWVAYTYIVFVPCYSAEWINNTLLNSALALFVRRNCRSATDFPRNPLDKAGWILTFEDDFNTGQIDYNAWKDHAWWGDRWAGDGVDIPNGQYPSIYFSPNCFSFGPSTVKLEATNIPANVTDPKSNIQFPVPYSVGRLEWIDKHDQQHGYFEIRCKIPGTIEQWPAFWLASRKSWPPEIDVFEFYTNNLKRFETTTWWGTNENRFKETWSHPVCKPDELFHVYACEWDENSIKFYYDNMLIRQSAQGIEEFVFPMHVIVCAGIDNRSGHHPENATYPNYFEVDYVRAYRKI